MEVCRGVGLKGDIKAKSHLQLLLHVENNLEERLEKIDKLIGEVSDEVRQQERVIKDRRQKEKVELKTKEQQSQQEKKAEAARERLDKEIPKKYENSNIPIERAS